MDGFSNRWFLDPLYGRNYPADMVSHFSRRATAQWPDFVHGRRLDAHGRADGFPRRQLLHPRDRSPGGERMAEEVDPDAERTNRDWLGGVSDGLYRSAHRLHFEYRDPEDLHHRKRCSYADAAGAEGRVPDARSGSPATAPRRGA